MTGMIQVRFCPNCKTERPASEIFCEGSVGAQQCAWDLSNELLRTEGWQPPPSATEPSPEPQPPVPLLVCVNGHTMDADDFICMHCGADRAIPGVPEPSQLEPTSPLAPASETVIDGWRLLRHLGGTPGVCDSYLAVPPDGGPEAVLTLYEPGAEPDPTIYEVLRRLPTEHVPALHAMGRWNQRAYEVMEHIGGGTLADLELGAIDIGGLRAIVAELGQALHTFSEVGLRHRDIRPATILVRQQEPLDLVIAGFGSARLADFDLDLVSPLEVSRYMAPEAIIGGVAAASDWWSLGMVLLERMTQGACFADVNERAFLIQVLANGVTLPQDLDPALDLLLRGLLAKDRHQRWQWPQVRAWLDGEAVAAPPRSVGPNPESSGITLALGTRNYHQPALFALAAAEARHWEQARDYLLRGALVTWAQEAHTPERGLAALRQIAHYEGLNEDFRLMLALKVLNPDIPLIHRGELVTPRWLLDHPLEGYELISGAVSDLLRSLGAEDWLSRLKFRIGVVRDRARNLGIDLDEERLRVNLLSTSRARLAVVWDEHRRLFPDSGHQGLLNLMEHAVLGEEDLIVLLSAPMGLFRSSDAIVEDATRLARDHGLNHFEPDHARQEVILPRLQLLQKLRDRSAGFARCGIAVLDEWTDQFRLERRLPLERLLVLLAVPAEHWQAPQKQQYFSQLLEFFERRVSTAVLRGPLVRMTIGKSTARVDLSELGTERVPSTALLDHLLQRGQQPIPLDPSAFMGVSTVEPRLHALVRHTTLYRRDTGIDGLYLGFPFLLTRDAKGSVRIAPLLLWPVRIHLELSQRRQVSLSFDNDREEVRLNPALPGIVGTDASQRWEGAVSELLGRSSLRAADVIDGLGMLATPRARSLGPLPSPNIGVAARSETLDCSAVLFHATFTSQAVGEELRKLKERSPVGTGLETCLRLNEIGPLETEVSAGSDPVRELDRYFTVSSDPSQESAVFQARHPPGLLIEGPPGTGKSQTIVNLVGDAIGRRCSLLIICQKHAALEVVYKRLVAEGLGERVLMIDDVNKDRIPIIKAVRAQVETLRSRGPEHSVALRRKRESIAARIESLEGEIDRHHAALHRIDERIGLSYRSLLGELIGLESPEPPPDIPVLRTHLQTLDVVRLASLEEEIAPLVRYWLPACYEGSALSVLRPFATDRATLEDFRAAWADFLGAEGLRMDVLQTHPAEFELENPAPDQAWLAAHGQKFLDLSNGARQRLAHWLPLFRSTEPGPTPGEALLSRLIELCDRLTGCPMPHYDARISPGLAMLADPTLRLLTRAALKLNSPTFWWRRLSPRRWVRKARVRRFLKALELESTPQLIDTVHTAGELERLWRPARAELTRIHTELRLPYIDATAGPSLLDDATTTRRLFAEIADLAKVLAAAPGVARLDAAVLTGKREALLALFATFHAAFSRHAARRDSLGALKSLTQWMEPAWVEQCHLAIENNESNRPRLDPIEQALPTLPAYQHFRTRAQRLSPEALAILAALRGREERLRGILEHELEAAVRRLLNREARLGWKRVLEQAEPDLLLERADLDSKVVSLAALDMEMRAMNRDLLREDFDRAHIGRPLEWEDITRLTGPRSRRLREFIELGVGLGLMQLRPVWLMNPDVASRVLPLKSALFDTVVYDEASQMPVEHALPTLYRGRICVVSGDEKQMPPTAFFTSKVESDEAEIFDGELPDEDAGEEEREAFEETWNRREIKDCPDLLQLARAALPPATLCIHYRSAYRELIAYSNACFYGNQLSVPVRHPEATIRATRPIEVVPVNSVYRDQTNPGEAEQVVEWLAELWRRPDAERPSTGVVTFNRKQADLIEDLLERRAEQDREFREAYRQELERLEQGEDMAVFVKNVENVQGDERDIIVFSSTFGRNVQGTFRRNFGVLGQKGGERRLNVAVTRARQKVVMVTSMPIAEISDLLHTQRPATTPRDFLQAYMEYARAVSAGELDIARTWLGRLAVSRESRSASRYAYLDDGFSADVAGFIRRLGYEIGHSPEEDVFGLDFAIADPGTKLFAIGIECDAPRHQLLSQARHREVWRPSVLRRAVPKIHRVSSYGWYHNPEAEKERLRDAIHLALPPKEAE